MQTLSSQEYTAMMTDLGKMLAKFSTKDLNRALEVVVSARSAAVDIVESGEHIGRPCGNLDRPVDRIALHMLAKFDDDPTGWFRDNPGVIAILVMLGGSAILASEIELRNQKEKANG